MKRAYAMKKGNSDCDWVDERVDLGQAKRWVIA
jgi:hypothetical protein